MSVLLFLLALVAPGITTNNCNSCLPPFTSCPCPCDISNFQTNYVLYGSASGSCTAIDNVCQTFFSIQDDDPCAYVAYISQVYCNGSNKVLSFYVSCNSSTTLIYTSTTCSFMETIVGRVGQTTVKVRSVISGGCTDIIRPALATNPRPSSGSPNELAQVNQLLSSNGYRCTNLYTLEGQYPFQCVTSQNSRNTGNCT